MRKRAESADSALRYFNKLVMMLKGRGYTEEGAIQTAVAAVAKRYQNFGFMMAAHALVKETLREYHINPIATNQYIAFVNAYIKRIQEGHYDEAQSVINDFKKKVVDPKIIDVLVDRIGLIEAESNSS